MSDVNDEDENVVQDENVNPIEEANKAKKKLLKSVYYIYLFIYNYY